MSDELKMSACNPAPGGNRSGIVAYLKARYRRFTFTPKQIPRRNAAPSLSSLPFPSFPCSLSHSSLLIRLQRLIYPPSCMLSVRSADSVRREGGGLTSEDCDPVRRALRLNRVQCSAEVRQQAPQPRSPIHRIRLFRTLEFV